MRTGRTLTRMTSTQSNRKAGGWLANYYLRGLIALVALLVAATIPVGHGFPVIVAVIVWIGLWAASRIRANS